MHHRFDLSIPNDGMPYIDDYGELLCWGITYHTNTQTQHSAFLSTELDLPLIARDSSWLAATRASAAPNEINGMQ